MINLTVVKCYRLLKSIDKKLDKLLKQRKPIKRNRHKPPAPSYMDK